MEQTFHRMTDKANKPSEEEMANFIGEPVKKGLA
jgi:hypothetical protein